MKQFLLFFLILSLFLLPACQNRTVYEEAEVFDISHFQQEIPLKGTSVAFDEPVMKPVKVFVADSLLVLFNIQMEYHLDLYNLRTLKKVGDCIPFGSGPDEMVTPTQLIEQDTTVWILDGGQQKLAQYGKNDFYHHQTPHAIATIQFSDWIDQVVFLKNGQMVTSLRTPACKRISFFNSKGEVLDSKGEYPVIKGKEMTTIEKLSGFVCELASNPVNSRIFVSYKETDLIEIYDEKGNLLHRKHGPDHFCPSVIQRNTGENIHVQNVAGETRDAYFCPVAYDNKIYVLYSGQSYEPDKVMYLMDRLCVFDWEGNPIQIYKLDTPIYNFTIDPQTNRIYGLTDFPECQVVQFQL